MIQDSLEDTLCLWVLHRIRGRLHELRRVALSNPSVESVRSLREYLVWIREELGL